MPLTLGQILFSGRTYQVEVGENWVFLQLEKGLATDVFCSCGHDSCAHALFAIKLLQGEEPLHERFERSFFRALFWQLHTDEVVTEGPPGVYRCSTCIIETTQKLEPSQEVETNSIKFCDRSPEEIERWRQGRASPEFAFELSFWSDLAKHYFVEQTVKKVPVVIEGMTVRIGPDRLITFLKSLPPLDPEACSKTLSWHFDGKALTLEGERYEGAALIALFKKRSKELRLEGFPLFETEAPLPATLSFDGKLHVHCEGHFIGPYAWIEGQGFFKKPSFVIKDLTSFMKDHPQLFQQEGFHIHYTKPKLNLTFAMDEEGIHFTADKGIFIDDDWLYIEGEGFYPRVKTRAGQTITWQELPEAEIEPELLLTEKPYKRLGLRLSALKGKIVGTLAIEESFPWRIVGPYFVVMGKGLYLMEEEPPRPFVVDESEAFLKNLPALLPGVIAAEQRLLPLTAELVGEHYETVYGPLDLWSMAKTLKEGRTLYRTPHGYIDLSEPRFEWLQKLETPLLTPLDRVRLEAYENTTPLWPEEKPLPALPHFKASLRPYQLKGLEWLWGLYQKGLSALLCDDMGLGKTYQAIAFLAAVGKGRFLILAPTSVIYHWLDKLKTCLPDKRISLYHGLDRNFDEKADVIITSYGVARSDRERLKRCSFEVIIFDEVQMAKNRASLTWISLAALKSRFRLGLTGTPIENNLKELKSLFDLVLPGFFASSHRFREQFIVPIEVHNDAACKELLQRLISPFILRRKKQDCLTELPGKTEDVVWCTLSEEQKSLYQQLLQERQATIAELRSPDGPFSYITLLALLIQLKKICNHPALFLKDPDWQAHTSAKWELFVDLLQEALSGGQKVVVFSHYLGMLDIIESYLREQGIGFASLRGSTLNRHDHIMRFQTDDNCRVFVASLQAGGLGIDLTAAATVIHYDRWWNAARENQATDRVHRMGQKLPVQVFKLATLATVEENIDKLISKKARLLEDIIALDGHTDFKKLTHEDWLEILSFLGSGKKELA